MTYSDIRNAITQRTGKQTFFEMHPGGPAIGVPALEDGVVHFSLVPIDDESRAGFVDFLVNLTGKPASASGPYPYNATDSRLQSDSSDGCEEVGI